MAESHSRMLQAATRLIATCGYTTTTLAAIGEQAGYSRGLVQHRYGSKDRLLEELIAQIAHQHRERLLLRMRGLSGLDALDCEIDCYLEGMDDPPEHSRAFFVLMLESIGPAPQVRHVFAQISARWHHALAGQVVKGQQQGQIRADADPAMEAQLLIATVRGLRMQSMLAPASSDVAQAIAAVKQALRLRLAVTARGRKAPMTAGKK